MRTSSIAPFAVSAAPSRARGRWLRAPVCRARRFGYSNDAAGRRTAISRSGEAFCDLSGAVDAYGYNLRSEVVSARRTKDGAPVRGFDEDFSYDPIGNRIATTNYTETGAAVVSEYTANSLNQYTSRTAPGVAAVRGFALTNATVTVNESPTWRLGEYFYGSDAFDNSAAPVDAALVTTAALASPTNGPDEVASVTSRVHIAKSPQLFAYDLDGNQTLITTKTGLWRVTYNGENRPICWVRDSDNTTLAMAYDHMGRRRVKNGQRFFYDGYLQVADNTGNSYIWDCTEPVATRPLAWCRDNFFGYYAHDGNKNVSEVIGSDGTLAAHYAYSSFGGQTISRGDFAMANTWRFSCEFEDDLTGLIYYNFRCFDPQAAKWMSRDPLFVGENDFAFVADPLVDYDYLGLRRFVSGGAGKKDWEVWRYAKRILDLINQINSIKDSCGRACYRIMLMDMVYASASEINAYRSQGADVFMIGHGAVDKTEWSEGEVEPRRWFVAGNGNTIDLSDINVDPLNMFGCYISDRVRKIAYEKKLFRKQRYHTDKDTYPTMYQSFEDRLRGKYLAKECCEKIREVYIYEGDAFPGSQNEKYYERSGTESYRRRYNESW